MANKKARIAMAGHRTFPHLSLFLLIEDGNQLAYLVNLEISNVIMKCVYNP